jgi:hypothetical protein
MIVIFAAGVVGLIVLMIAMAKPDAYSSMLVVATFLSRVRRPVGGFEIRLEMALAAIAGLALLLGPRDKTRLRQWPGLFLLVLWLAWLAVVSMAHSPDVQKSAVIVAWLALDMVAAYYIIARVTTLRPLISTGIWCALLSSIAAVALWASATAGHGHLLVQPDPAYGGYSAYVGALESNILAELVILWSVVALSDRLCGHVNKNVRRALILMTPVVGLCTHTRIAVVCSLIVLGVALVRNTLQMRVPVVFLGLATVMYAGTINIDALGLTKFSQPFSLQQGTGLYRAVTWQTALNDVHNSSSALLTGLGANSFGQRHLDPSLPDSNTPWYLGNLPLQLFYDGGIVALILVVCAVLRLLRSVGGATAICFVVVYVIMGTSTSSLWLMQSWIFVGIAALVASPIKLPEAGRVPARV